MRIGLASTTVGYEMFSKGLCSLFVGVRYVSSLNTIILGMEPVAGMAGDLKRGSQAVEQMEGSVTHLWKELRSDMDTYVGLRILAFHLCIPFWSPYIGPLPVVGACASKSIKRPAG